MARFTYPQIDQLVWLNNQSNIAKTIFIAQIYKESRFDPAAKNPGSTATGLMQMTVGAVTEVNRVNKTSYKHADMKIPESNIIAGTTYLQILFNRWGGLASGLDKYGTGPGYSNNIMAASIELAKNPADPMAVLAKFIGKP